MIIFNIRNQQIEYENCFLIIQYLRNPNKKGFYLDTPVKIKYVDDRDITNKQDYNFNLIYKKCIVDNNFIEIQNSESLNNIIQNIQNGLAFCFYINDIGESDDIVQLHYFELIRKFEKNCYLFIDSTNENYFRISDFYQIESIFYEETYSYRYFKEISEEKVKRFAKISNNASRYFLPLLRTDGNTYSLLSKNILELFTFSETELLSFKTLNTNDTLLQNKQLLRVVQDFYMKLLNEINHYIKNQKINFDWSKCREIVSHTSVLGLCYFLSYLYAVIRDEAFSINRFAITQLLLQSEDFAIGTIQLIENAFKHAESGYFCYRIHCSNNKKTYLKNNYNIKYNKKTAPFYLEILISDFNEHYNIPQKFIQNLKYRLSSNNEVSPELIDNFNNELKLKDFFDPSDVCKKLWQKYYENTSNIALHYGLNIFEQIIKSSAGKFMLTSSNTVRLTQDEIYDYTFDNNVSAPHIPGTQYKIILPIQIVNSFQQSTGLKFQLDIKQLKNNWHQRTIKFVKSDSLDSKPNKYDIYFSSFKSNATEYKEAAIRKLLKIIKRKVKDTDKNTIIVFNVEEFVSSLQSEIFSKTLICLLGDVSLEKIAIINASHQFMATFIRVFGLIYYKRNTHIFLSNSEIYLCGHFDLDSDNNVEILFKGDSIADSLFVSKQMADYKGEYSFELSLLENLVKKCEKSHFQKRSADIFPFDVLINSSTNKTLFQEKAFYDLNQNLQHYHFGCKLSDVHMKVGSKIHITSNFYEATLLFSIKNYISRFAYLLAKNISEIPLKNSKKSNIILIGYETYSEALMIETKNILKQIFKINAEYLIYDDTAKENKFRGTNHYSNFSEMNYVIIVPIGSTLTTHDKIAAELKREFQRGNNINIVANLCVVLVRDDAKETATLTEIESSFWDSITMSSVVLKSNYNIGNDNLVNYIVSVSSKWEKPDECLSCFPTSVSDEKPILKVNKASVVPMIMMGINEPGNGIVLNNTPAISHGNIENLKNHLKFGHFKRGDNHFEYYFNTESIIADEANNKALNQWYTEIKHHLKNEFSLSYDSTYVKYDFVVAPQHTTNAEFVLQVNEKVFDNTTSILFLDVKKEYRDNIKTKLSNLTQLYTNLVLYGKPAVINFHYVDDTITTGNNFKRAKSLIQSLFPENSLSDTTCRKVKVNVFNSVILLLGRCSSDTKLSYVPSGKFFAFFELNISALRNHVDACVLCKKHNDYEDMRKMSSTNALKKVFSSLANDYCEIEYTEKPILNQNDGFKRMLFTNELNQRLSILGFEKNNNETVEKVLLQFIIDIFNDVFSNTTFDIHTDCLCILILVISNPFVIFRKSVLSASFKLLLKIAEYLIDQYHRDSNYLPPALQKHIINMEKEKNNCNLKKLIKTLFTAISNLGANFVMQINTIVTFFAYVKDKFPNDFVEDQCDEWTIYYCQIIIQSLMLNRQDSRVLWLEKTLTSDEFEDSKTSLSVDANIKMLKQVMLLENTLILSDTLDEAVYSIQNTLKNIKDNIKNETEKDLSEIQNKENLLQKLNSFTKISEETDTNLLLIILFNKNGELRNQEKLKESLETTLKSYFCEAFRQFSEIQNNSLKCQQLLDMSILYLLLLPNSSLSGARKEHLKFYDTLLKQIKTVLGVGKVQLFMTHNETIDFICSSDDNSMDWDKEYEKFIQKITSGSLKSIGETYYIDKSNSCLNAIKIDNNSLSNDMEAQTAWYLVFEVAPDLSVQKLLKNARNLLVMRENLLLRLKKDYDNNLYAEFSELRKKVKKLTDDKAGGHTPFAEISAEFDYLYKLSIKCRNSKECEVKESEEIANSMKLITDLLISKLYVCHINEDSYPKQIETRKSDMQYHVLRNYKEMIMSAGDLVLRKDNSLTFRPKIHFNVNWDKNFEFMKKSAFIWLAIYYALIMNALRHGQTTYLEDDPFSQYVQIDVRTDETHLIISNQYIPQEKLTQKIGITLETISAFLSHYGFALQIDENYKNYTVKIPLIKDQSTQQEGNGNK